MIFGILFIYIINSGSVRADEFFIHFHCDQQISFNTRPVRGEKVYLTYELTPRENMDSVRIVFHNFRGVELLSGDTLRFFNARSERPVKFYLNLRYVDTPASFEVVLSRNKYYGGIGTFFTRYLMDNKTGVYGSMREIQYQPPVEYRFDPNSRKFEGEIYGVAPNRWQKNRGIIDTVKTLAADLPDSLCLVLYAEAFRISWISSLSGWQDRVNFLLQKGWLAKTTGKDRDVFVSDLIEKVKTEQVQREKHEALSRILRQRRWLLSWIKPTAMLLVVLVLLLFYNRRKKTKKITPKTVDRILVYIIYAAVIGVAFYFARPYLGIKASRSIPETVKRARRLAKVNFERQLADIERGNYLNRTRGYTLLSKGSFGYRDKTGCAFEYEDNMHSRFGVHYRFAVGIVPDSGGYVINNLDTILLGEPLTEGIRRFESDPRAAGFLSRCRSSKASVQFGINFISFLIEDTIQYDKRRMPVRIYYDGKAQSVSRYTVPPDIDDRAFPEIKRLKELLGRANMRLNRSSEIIYDYIDYSKSPALSVLVEGCGNDRLLVWFFSERADDFTFRWIPKPEQVEVPQEIIDQIRALFVDAGLDLRSSRECLQFISPRSIRWPNHFDPSGDLATVETQIKWLTNIPWVDNFNDGEGIRFNASFVIRERAKQLLRVFYLPRIVDFRSNPDRWNELTPIRFFVRSAGPLLGHNKARKKLFDMLEGEQYFCRIFVTIDIQPEPISKGGYFYLCGVYAPPVRGYQPAGIVFKVDLETGETSK